MTLGPILGVFPLEQTRHVGVAKSERPRLTNVKLFSKNSNLCDHDSPTSQTDRQTDRRTTCDRNTALCTKVHRAVKIADNGLVSAEIRGITDYSPYWPKSAELLSTDRLQPGLMTPCSSAEIDSELVPPTGGSIYINGDW